jgi:hypothetical protein
MTSEKSIQPRPDTSEKPASKEQRQTPPIGEGSYEGTRDYQKNIQTYLENADVAADAQAARLADAAEAQALKQAEQEGLSHTKSRGQ